MGSARTTTPRQPTDRPGAATDDAAALVAALALALRNLAIYPATHPRVRAAAADCQTRLAARSAAQRDVILGQRDGTFFVDADAVAADEGPAARLLQEFRDAGLRGIAFAPDCTSDDLLAFAQALAQTRTQKGTPFQALWPADHPRLRATDLVFRGAFRAPLPGEQPGADQGEGPPGGTGPAVDPAVLERRQQIIAQLATEAGITSRLTAIERGLATTPHDDAQSIDLLQAIAELLPVDVAHRPELVVDAVQKVLDQLEQELPQLQRSDAPVEGADLLRMALGIARKYFLSTAPETPQPPPLPSGRPEDEAIDADLPRLLQQLETLPATCPRLPPATEFVATHATMARELLGIHMHTLCNTDRPEVKAAVRQRLRQMLVELDPPRRDVLRTYLGGHREPAPAGDAVRELLIDLLVEAGQAQFVLELGFVDATYLARHFPESLRLAARVLGSTPTGLAILRDGLRALAPVLALGGVATALRAGVLQDPTVITALLEVGDASAQPLLDQLAQREQPAIRRQLITFLQRQPLHPAEATVLASLDAVALPASYVLALLRGGSAPRFDASLRAASGKLLRMHVEQVERRTPANEHERLLTAMDTLQHVPGAATTALLQKLAARGRLAVFDASARAIRRRATELLARVPTGGSQ